MKTLGILGGIGPESTIDYYRSIIAGYRQQKSDGSYPAIVITSLDVQKLLAWMTDNQSPSVIEYLVAEARRLAAAGADFGLIAANTPHIVFDEIQQQSPIPLLSIVEAACAAAKSRGIAKAGLLGTRFTMQGHFYSDVFSRVGIALIMPDEVEQTYIHDIYVNELLQNKFLPATRHRLVEIIQSMRRRAEVGAVILAGTELPLLLKENDVPGIPLLDTTRLHVDAAVKQLLS